eukprot:scaffold8263_cov104-Isochrysis_galbana.AAC.1
MGSAGRPAAVGRAARPARCWQAVSRARCRQYSIVLQLALGRTRADCLSANGNGWGGRAAGSTAAPRWIFQFLCWAAVGCLLLSALLLRGGKKPEVLRCAARPPAIQLNLRLRHAPCAIPCSLVCSFAFVRKGGPRREPILSHPRFLHLQSLIRYG